MNSALKLQVLKLYRDNLMNPKRIGEKLGFNEKTIEKIIFPNKRISQSFIVSKTLVNMKKIKSEVKKTNEKSVKNPVMVLAGKKAWKTRRENEKVLQPKRKLNQIVCKVLFFYLRYAKVG